MSQPNTSSQLLIALCAPFLIALISAEYALSKKRGIVAYRSLNETLSNLSCGVGQQLVDLFLNVPVLVGYVALQRSTGLPRVAPTAASLLALFVLIDGIYYAYHRLSHHVPLLWAVHQIHHQSEEFNFSVGLRQAWFHKLVSFPIYILPALLGYGPELYVPVAALHAVLQTWTHTQLVKSRLRGISWLLVVPYVHRVHHGANQECVNRNFGGILSVWDRLFGSYREVEREPVYGITRGPGTFDPWGANVAPLTALADEARKVRGVRAKLRVLLVPGPLTTREFELKAASSPPVFRTLLAYAVILLPAVAFFGLAPGLGVAPRFFGALVFLIVFSTFGRSLDSSDAEALSGRESLA